MFDANLALSQLTGTNKNGVGRLKAMIGAKNFAQSGADNYVQFQFMRGAKNKANRIQIKLNSMDLYDVRFFNIRKCEVIERGTFNDVYGEDLKSIFEDATSLYLSL